MDVVNKAIFLGRLANDPVLSTTKNGHAAVSFTLAYNYGYGEKKESYFVRLRAFNKQAELLAERCCKGTQLMVECQIRPTKYEKDGRTVYSTEFWVQGMELLGSKLKNNAAWDKPLPGSQNAVLPGLKPMAGNPDDFVTVPDGIEDEIPFT